MSRAEQTRQAIRVARVISPRRRGRPPRAHYPRAIERSYAKALRGIVKDIETVLKPLVGQLGGLVASAEDSARLDAGEARAVSALMEDARRALQISQPAAERLAGRFAEQVNTHQKVQLGRQVRAAFGADVIASEPNLAGVVESFVVENVALINDIPAAALHKIEGQILRGISQGTRSKAISKEIANTLQITKRRADLIARDQVAKFYSKVTEYRQKALGVTHYIWRTSGDERVRPEHRALDGRSFSWEEGAPGEGHPGGPIQCRCNAEPDLDALLDGL